MIRVVQIANKEEQRSPYIFQNNKISGTNTKYVTPQNYIMNINEIVMTGLQQLAMQ